MMAVGAASGRVCYVFFIDGKLCDWGLSRDASKSPQKAAEQAEAWFAKLRPEVVVTEKTDERSRKGARTKRVIAAIAHEASEAGMYDIAVPRTRAYDNKYKEAAALAKRFPALSAWVPETRKIWKPEPKNVTYFEALSLALQVIDGKPPPERA